MKSWENEKIEIGSDDLHVADIIWSSIYGTQVEEIKSGRKKRAHKSHVLRSLLAFVLLVYLKVVEGSAQAAL